MIRARLIDSTNIIVATNFKNCEGIFYVQDGMVFIENENSRDRHTELHRTSLVVDLWLEEDILSVKTLNSLYRYKILEGTIEAISNEFAKMNLELAIEIEKERERETCNYIIQDKDGFLNAITLPYSMNWVKATEYIVENKLPVRIIKAVFEEIS